MANKKKASSKRNKNQHHRQFLRKKEVVIATCGGNNGVQDDIISELNDDVLASIISRLPLADAVSTNILSRRWRHLSTYSTRLNFSAPKKPSNYENGPSNEEEEFAKYADMVDRTINSHKGGRFLEEFRIHDLPFYRRRSPWAHVERWLEFALSKQVQIVELQMKDVSSSVDFPLSSFIADNCENLIGFKSVKELSLRGVDVDDQDLEMLLKNFVLLEHLSIEHSGTLKEVSIQGDLAPHLKCLDISSCVSVESVEIRDLTSLVSLRLVDLTTLFALELKNVPMLIEINTCDNSGYAIEQIFSEAILSRQLVKLSLTTDPSHIMICDTDFLLPKLAKVEQMEVEANMYGGCSIHQLCHMVEACPSLHYLEIKFIWWGCQFQDRTACGHKFEVNSPNNNLKKVKLSGFMGCTSELEFVSQILTKAVELEELLIEISAETRKMRHRARARVWQHLQPMLRNSVNFVIT